MTRSNQNRVISFLGLLGRPTDWFCRKFYNICEEEVPTSKVEDHSRICAVADRCDQKGLSVDERLVRIAEMLEKMTDLFANNAMQHSGSPDVAKISNSSVTEESDVPSPKLSDWSRRGSEDMLDCFPEVDNSILMVGGM
ncbi:hypothetical protein F3Y22_tig00019229pilonHSYRG00009 [Hibiscus syriacus]|uniref:Uncharacterized protein n=1 Tax=Hibiscus syriacus TaxID=106335 RepID=A0A6A3BYH1_HIBSY|nr:hypothetical protein F3Y22_tig00019229pilonHSYRG00009 [Hibiscus syriacus]